MLKLGILRRELAPANPRRPVALTMLDQFTGTLSTADEQTLHRLYRSVRICESGNKRTFPLRYRSLDDEIANEIDTRFPTGAVSFHDMAASNAVTSTELFGLLKKRSQLSFRASDYFDALTVVAMPGSGWRIVFDREGQPLQFLLGRLVISAKEESRKYPINRLIGLLVSRFILPRARPKLEGGDGQALSLWHPVAERLAATDERFLLAHDDLFHPTAGSYSAVRIMNACHIFDPASLPAMFAAVGRTIDIGGLLIVGHRRGEESLVNASFYERDEIGYRHLRDMNAGFNLKSAVSQAVITR